MSKFENETGISIAQLMRDVCTRTLEILEHVAGIPGNKLDGDWHTCPACGATFALFDGNVETVYCSQCFNHEKNRDPIATVCHFRSVNRPVALRLIADYLQRVPAEIPFRTVKTWTYDDHEGKPVYYVDRIDGTVNGERKTKHIRYQKYHGKVRDLYYIPPMPFNVNAIDKRYSETLYFVESENCCDAVTSLGLLATTASGGRKAMFKRCKAVIPKCSDECKKNRHWYGMCPLRWSNFIMNQHVVILPHNDKIGYEYALRVAHALQTHTVQIVKLPGLQEGEDVADWVKRGGTRDELETIAAETPVEIPVAKTPVIVPYDSLYTKKSLFSDN